MDAKSPITAAIHDLTEAENLLGKVLSSYNFDDLSLDARLLIVCGAKDIKVAREQLQELQNQTTKEKD